MTALGSPANSGHTDATGAVVARPASCSAHATVSPATPLVADAHGRLAPVSMARSGTARSRSGKPT